jgi:hypothetical protein
MGEIPASKKFLEILTILAVAAVCSSRAAAFRVFCMGWKVLRNSVDSATAGVFCAAQQARSAVVFPLI